MDNDAYAKGLMRGLEHSLVVIDELKNSTEGLDVAFERITYTMILQGLIYFIAHMRPEDRAAAFHIIEATQDALSNLVDLDELEIVDFDGIEVAHRLSTPPL